MAQSFSVEEIIRRPASQVWDTLTDWSVAHRWMPGIDRTESHGDTVAGTQFTFQARGADRTTTITRCDVGRSITLRSVQGGVTADSPTKSTIWVTRAELRWSPAATFRGRGGA